MQGAVYAVLVRFLDLVTRVFFRSVEVVGRAHVPKAGPVIFVGNHPNSLIDPVILTTTCGRRVRFAAKDTLFKSWLLRPFLWALGSVPIRRRVDHAAEGARDNADAFEALHAVLASGGAFGIFPEGISYSASELQPLKTGAARIALGALAGGIPVVILPCGLQYRQRQRFRGQVLVQYGRPIVLDDHWREAHAADPRTAATQLTEEIELSLRALTVNAPDFDTLRVLDGVRRLYSPDDRDLSLADEAEITRRLAAHWERHRDVPEISDLYADVESYLVLLDALGLTDWDLRLPVSRSEWALRMLRHVLLLAVHLPLALPGLVLHFPVLFVAVRAGEAVVGRSDVVATMKMILATVSVMFTYLVIAVGLFVALHRPYDFIVAPLALFALVLSGWATIRVLERQAVLRRGAFVLLRIMDLRAEVARLRAQRHALRVRLVGLVERYADASLGRIVDDDELRRSVRKDIVAT